MKNVFLFLLLFLWVSLPIFAQTEVVIRNKKPAFITQLSSPLTEMRVDIEDDFTGYFSKMEIPDTFLVFRTNYEYNTYMNKYERARKDMLNPKTKKKGVTLPDITPYLVKNRELVRPGLEIDLFFDEYRISQRNIARHIVIQTKLEGNDHFEGIYEGVSEDGLAVVDGKTIRLKQGAYIEGTEGFKGQNFHSFKDMMIGSFVRVYGKRQSDGILLVERGTAWENKEMPDDLKLKQSLRNTMKITSSEVSFGQLKFLLLKNADLSSYVSQIGRLIVPSYQKELPKGHPVKIDFNFYVVEDSTFNACAYPDGSIFVHTALLAQLENEAQLAAILGHEIAHVTYEHARMQIRKQRQNETTAMMFAFFTVVAGVLPADVAILAAGLGGPALSSFYSRSLEEQADRAGLTYMYQAGFDPREAGKVWKKMYELTDASVAHFGSNLLKAAEKGINSIYASHPDALKRYKNVNRLIALNYHDEDLTGLKVNQPQYRSKMKSMRKWLQGTPYFEPEPEPKPVKPTPDTTNPKKEEPKPPKPKVKKANQKAVVPVTKKSK